MLNSHHGRSVTLHLVENVHGELANSEQRRTTGYPILCPLFSALMMKKRYHVPAQLVVYFLAG
jgi:hypothetical protein